MKDRMIATPINALQNRTSAHFTEINSLYLHDMTKKYIEKTNDVIEERSRCP
jgi:hypothetical protein